MRWQEIDSDDGAALVGMRGFLRSVRTPEFAGATFHEVACKSALNRVPAASSMPFRWTINPTRGCLHQCRYCFARKTHEYLDLDAGKDFDTQIIVKVNIVDVLRAELAKPTWQGEHVALGTNSDPYMRAEGRYQLMPGIIDALTQASTPFSILTKGSLLRRDIPLLVRSREQVSVDVGVSLAFMDPALQQAVEPGTPTPSARLKLVRALAEAGLEPMVMAMPILPFLTDSQEHLDSLIAAVAEAGGQWVTVGPLHLRSGARQWFMSWLRQAYPTLVPRYEVLYQDGAYASGEYRAFLRERVERIRKKHGFAARPHLSQRARWPLRSDPADISHQVKPGNEIAGAARQEETRAASLAQPALF